MKIRELILMIIVVMQSSDVICLVIEDKKTAEERLDFDSQLKSASYYGEIEKVRDLWARDIRKEGNYEDALYFACTMNQCAVAELLISNGAPTKKAKEVIRHVQSIGKKKIDPRIKELLGLNDD